MEKLVQRHRQVPGHCPAGQTPLSAAGSRPSRAAAAYIASSSGTDSRLPAAGDVTPTSDANGGVVGGALIDESEEWAKIENIMASLDAGLSDCDGTNGVTVMSSSAPLQPISRLQPPSTALSTDAGEVPSQPVGLWLASIRLSHLEDVLLSNGFDDVDFLGPGFLSDSDLIEMGVANSDDRRKLLAAASRLPSYATRTPCQFESMRSWLKALRLSEYTEAFQTHGFTTLDRLHNLWDVELTSVLRISRLGHRNRILAAIGSLPTPSVPPIGVKGQLDDDAWCTKSAKQSLNELSLYKDYTTLLNKRSKTSHSLTVGKELQTTASQQQQQQQQQQNHHKKQQPQLQHAVSSHSKSSADSLRIRPPQTSTDCEIKQWSHQPEVLMRGGCKYAALYVGSGAVDQLDDADATRRAIANIRQRSVAQSTGVTSVTITISHTGVEFSHARTKEVLGCHEIGNIFCACQDASLLDYFAFVTWQPTVGQHHCHVFCAENVQMAVEVVLTLGQAFEVAYQLAVLRTNADTTAATLPINRISTAPRGGLQKCPTGSSNGTRTLPLDGRSVISAGSQGVALHIY